MITNVGQLLKKERENRNISLEEVEKATRIRMVNLEAIENENWEHFPSRTYIQGVIKGYGAYLQLDEDKLIAYFRREYERNENLKFKQKAKTSQYTPLSRRIITVLITLIVIGLGSFFGYQLYLFSVPPKVTILEPQETTFKRVDKVTLRGTAAKETVITVNGRQAFMNENATFEIDVPLPEPRNKVIIEAVGANGKKTVIEKIYTVEN